VRESERESVRGTYQGLLGSQGAAPPDLDWLRVNIANPPWRATWKSLIQWAMHLQNKSEPNQHKYQNKYKIEFGRK